jgi:hypothetical protein
MKILLPAVAALGTTGCGNEVPPPAPTAQVSRPEPAPYVFGGRFQGVASNNQFAVWVVDTQTGAVARCDTQACAEWVLPKAPGWTPAPGAQPAGPPGPIVPGLGGQK